MRVTAAVVVMVVWAAVLVLPGTRATLGLVALKLLKFAGLAKLKGLSGGLGGIGELGGLREPDYYDNQFGSPIYTGGPPAFYVVPASHFDDYRYRGRRDTEYASGSIGGRRAGAVVATEEEFFSMLVRLDEDECVLRLVCELARTPAQLLTSDERAIMAIFSTTDSRPTAQGPRGSRGEYDSAFWLGRTSSNPAQTCPGVYKKCPSPPRKLVAALSFGEETQQAQTTHLIG